MTKPFLKWVGGKYHIVENITDSFPKEMNDYHEPFVGGGGVLFYVLSLINKGEIKVNGKVYAYDINPVLINMYKNIQENIDELYESITKYLTEYNELKGNEVNKKPTTIEEAKGSRESYYYWIRDKFNKLDPETPECSALFIILNNLCHRGIYREGPKGFNVPYGNYKNPKIISITELNNIKKLILDVTFIKSDFIFSIKKVKRGDFVYLDPPCLDENGKSKTGYIYGSYNENVLLEEINKFDGIKFVISNTKVIESFKNVKVQNTIINNSKKTEVIIRN